MKEHTHFSRFISISSYLTHVYHTRINKKLNENYKLHILQVILVAFAIDFNYSFQNEKKNVAFKLITTTSSTESCERSVQFPDKNLA